jgi:hypothetical protein
MITAHKQVTQRASSLRDFVGIGAVADNVTQIEDAVIRGGGAKAGLQCFQVGVDVRDYKNAHATMRV